MLYGGTGHAFIINMNKAGCASGPTAWRMARILNLAHNLGLSVQGVWGSKSDKDSISFYRLMVKSLFLLCKTIAKSFIVIRPIRTYAVAVND